MTLGDPAGVGPEIVAAACSLPEVHQWCRPVIVGPAEIVHRAAALRGVGAEVVSVAAADACEPSPGRLVCLACGPEDAAEVKPGAIDARAGQAAFEAVVLAAQLALNGRVDAITTALLHKEALHGPGTTTRDIPSCWPRCAASTISR